MQAFLEHVVKELVDHPDAVSVTPVQHGPSTLYELRVDPDDVGKIIGRQGATINAIRALLLVGSAKKGLRCSLEIVEDEDELPPVRPQELEHDPRDLRGPVGSPTGGSRATGGGGGGRPRGAGGGGSRGGTPSGSSFRGGGGSLGGYQDRPSGNY